MTEVDWKARFKAGFSTPSTTAIASASATVLLLTGLSIYSVGPSWLTGGRVRWIAAEPGDDAAFVTARLYDMEHFPEGSVVLIGGSGLRESMTSPAGLQAVLSEKAGRDVPVVDLTMNGQTLIESAALIEEIDRPATILLGLGLVNLQYTFDDMVPALRPPRLGIRNEVLVDEMGRIGWPAPPSTGWPMVDYTRLYATRLPHIPVNLLLGGREQRVHEYIGAHPRPAEELYEDWSARRKLLEENSPMHRAVLGRLVERARADGHTVLLFKGPLRTDIFGDDGETEFFEYWFDMEREILEELELVVVGIEAAALKPTDYADPVHINNEDAQARITDTVAEQLTGLLPR